MGYLVHEWETLEGPRYRISTSAHSSSESPYVTPPLTKEELPAEWAKLISDTYKATPITLTYPTKGVAPSLSEFLLQRK